jgi:hypothetical protein
MRAAGTNHLGHRGMRSFLLLGILWVVLPLACGLHVLARQQVHPSLAFKTKAATARWSPPLASSKGVNNDQEHEEEQRMLDWKSVSRQFHLFREMAGPYYSESGTGRSLLLGLLGMTLLNSGVSVLFSYLGKDFWNALSAKDAAVFLVVMEKYLAALCLGGTFG